MKRKRKEPPGFRYAFPKSGSATARRQFQIDRDTGRVREIEPAGLHLPDPKEEFLTLVESERAHLRDMARRLEHPATTPRLRESGEAMLEELAQLLAKARAAKIGSDMGAIERRAIGERTAKRVQTAMDEGKDPQAITGERNVRRIKSRKK